MSSRTPQWMKNFRRDMTVNALNFFQWLLKHTPRGFIQGLINLVFPFAYSRMKKLRKICLSNYKFVYGGECTDDEIEEMVKKNFDHITVSMIDLLYYVERPQQLSEITEIQGEENLKAALAKGKGALALTGHYGNFPLMFVSLVQKGYKVNVIIRPMRNQDFSVFMYDLCSRWKINMIQLQPRRKFISECLGALKRNELLFFLMDEEAMPENGIQVKFFNDLVCRAPGPLLFESRTGSPILPMFIVKNEDGRFDVHVEPELEMERGLSPNEHQLVHVRKWTQIIEKYVRKHPHLWGGWLNKRWSKR